MSTPPDPRGPAGQHLPDTWDWLVAMIARGRDCTAMAHRYFTDGVRALERYLARH